MCLYKNGICPESIIVKIANPLRASKASALFVVMLIFVSIVHPIFTKIFYSNKAFQQQFLMINFYQKINLLLDIRNFKLK